MRHPRRPRRARLAAARLRARAGSARAVCMTALALLACMHAPTRLEQLGGSSLAMHAPQR